MYALSLTQQIQSISHPHYKNFKVTVNAPTPNPRIVMDQLRHRNVNVTNAAGAICHWSKTTTAVGKSSGSERYHPWNTLLAAGSHVAFSHTRTDEYLDTFYRRGKIKATHSSKGSLL